MDHTTESWDAEPEAKSDDSESETKSQSAEVEAKWDQEVEATLQGIPSIKKLQFLSERWNNQSYAYYIDLWNGSIDQRIPENMKQIIQWHYWLIQEIDEKDHSAYALEDRAALVASLKNFRDLLGQQIFDLYSREPLLYHKVDLS
jgi:hypothetical protein